jgi:hypothetical protein
MTLSEAELRHVTSPVQRDWEDRYKALDREFTDYRTAARSLVALFEDLRAAVVPLEPLGTQYAKPKKSKRVSSECAAVMRISDGHHGAVQLADEIEGLNAFNAAISRKRQLGYAASLVDWVDLHRHAYTIPDLHVIVTGDMISGDIHEELRRTNEWPTPVQSIRAGELLAEQVALLAPHFGRVVVEYLVEDNHARLTKKPQAKEAGLNSFNYVVGSHAAALLAAHGNVLFRLHPVYETVVHVLTRNYLVCHGHGVKGWAGVPWYGIERKVGRESQARLRAIMETAHLQQEERQRALSLGFHKYLFGHFHTSIDAELYDCCPSVSGTDAYDHKEGRYSIPGQVSWLVHPEHGEFDRTRWDLRVHD